ncbi:chemotaxis protein CheC [Trichocoleus sp. FACHB-591]|uniref:chemotaxis protein CheC n=1 Tax=Trichocoleus sp. FACHB-591 TaxID=2692872 RepID=UPI0016860183|nr:chemotaxis protein CheC [Trichocoleus sp. FACHB-591]MBD2098736.1 chemotaxis protein CheC [Trichocoleus sp. FACHB-591]
MMPTVYELDALQELVNIGVGRAASILNEMVGSHVHLQIPYTKLISSTEVQRDLEQQLGVAPISAVRLGFNGSFAGVAQLVFPTDSASKLVAVLTREEFDLYDLDAVKIGTLSEVGNIVINGVMGSISNVLQQHLNYSLPIYLEDTVGNLLTSHDFEIASATVLIAKARFTIEQLLIAGDIILIFKLGALDTLLTALNLGLEESA